MKKLNYKQQELQYWEKYSCFQLVLSDYNENYLYGLETRINSIDGVKVIDIKEMNGEDPGFVKFTYNDEEYDFIYHLSEFSFYPMYAKGPYYVSEEELDKIANSSVAINMLMQFRNNPKKCFHLQLKLALALAPSLNGIIDESAEKLLPLKWVKMCVESDATPSANDLYTVQAISGDDGSIWLHTHGLSRCGTSELEILNSDKENYNTQYNLLTTYASYLLDDVSEIPYYKMFRLGYFYNNNPIVVTCAPWNEVIKDYKNLTLGNPEDRKESHNARTSVIFLYMNEKDVRKKRLTKVEEVNNLWSNNPLFFISHDETRIRATIARERFHYLKDLAKNEENQVFVKVGIPINDKGESEHIYFRLVSFENDKFKAVLLQEPYNDIKMKPGDEGIFSVDQVSDWEVDTKQGTITPSRVYLLN